MDKFETWWKEEGEPTYNNAFYDPRSTVKRLCLVAWENGKDEASHKPFKITYDPSKDVEIK